MYTLQDLVLAGVVWELRDNCSPLGGSQSEAKGEAMVGGQNNIPPTDADASTPPNGGVVAPVIPTCDLLSAAAAAASGAKDFAELCTAIENFPHPLKSFARTILPRITNHQSRITIITDSPSSDDDASGEIMSGAAGEMLDKMLGAIGITRDQVSIIPLVFWRAPGGRTVTEEEYALAKPFALRAMDFAKVSGIRNQEPVVLALGSNIEKHITDTWSLIPDTFFTIPHPNYLILKPDAKKDAWAELQKIQNLLQSPNE